MSDQPTPGRPATMLAGLLGVASGRVVPPGADAAVHDVTHDSAQAGPGVLFACRPGRRVDGHDFAAQAVSAGSPALLVQRELDLPVPQLVTPDVAGALGAVAARVHGHPSAAIRLIGVTGTNGKTTSAYLLEAALRGAGHRTGLIGTVETRIAGRAVPGVRTTPESTDLQRLLARMRAEGVDAAAMEVSSHGLALGRVAGTRFAAAIFTNLSQDHLDFHADLEDYFAAKASLFTQDYTDVAVVNCDDPWGRRLADECPLPVVRVSVAGQGDVGAEDVVLDPQGARFTAVLRAAQVPVRIQLPGAFNVTNVLGVLAALEAVGEDVEAAAAGIAALAGVPGRMERVDAGQPFTVLVDYAHTPDSVEHVLSAARGLSGGRVIVVLGCGGDRDAGKRPLMGRAAAAGADLAVLTSDNPRSEDPGAILAAMAAGAADVPGAAVVCEIDRADAIRVAVAQAADGDVVVIAGKGHEATQEFADRTVPFDDRLVARAALEQLGHGGPE